MHVFRTKHKPVNLSIAHQVTQTNIPPKELVIYDKETQTATELADKEGRYCYCRLDHLSRV